MGLVRREWRDNCDDFRLLSFIGYGLEEPLDKGTVGASLGPLAHMNQHLRSFDSASNGGIRSVLLSLSHTLRLWHCTLAHRDCLHLPGKRITQNSSVSIQWWLLPMLVVVDKFKRIIARCR